MACGTPEISTDLPTCVPWVNLHGESGLWCPRRPGGSSEAVRRIRGDPALRNKLAAERWNGPEPCSTGQAVRGGDDC
jgi:hypothetical protein